MFICFVCLFVLFVFLALQQDFFDLQKGHAWTDTSRASGLVFEPTEGDLTVHVTVRCERPRLHIDFRLIWTLQDRRSPKITV